ncbi:MAG: restriction endonuclease subunit S [Candidatus Cloacimonetes bacterium]|nr:restriction endonuclease subunit S [Candidatus Cloacimonadota bacterium]
MSNYALKETLPDDRIFLLKFSELNERFDPLYIKAVENIKNNIESKAKYECNKLIISCSITRGRFGHRPRNDPEFYGGTYPFIQTGDIVKASENYGKIEYTQTLNEKGLKTSKMFLPPQLLFTIAANIGDTAILDFPSCFPDSIVALTPHNSDELLLKYFDIYLKIIKIYIVELAPYSAQRNLNNRQLAQIPLITPPKEIQLQIIELFYEAVNIKKQKEAEANELIASIDDYLLNELGISLPEKDNSLESRIFITSLNKMKEKRFDSEYYQTYYDEVSSAIIDGVYETNTMNNFLNFIESGSRPQGGVKNINSGIFSIGGEHVNNKCEVGNGNPKFIPKEFHNKHLQTETQLFDIILVKDGATTGKVGIIDNEDFVRQNVNEHVFLIRVDKTRMTPEFLTYILFSQVGQIQLNREITGATVTGLTKSSVKSIQIPSPALEKQKEISEHINKMRDEAKKLKEEANEIFEIAKREIEKLILG